MQMEIKHLHQRLGVTVVYVTHDQGEALTMSDRVAVFHQGEIQQIAAPRTLYEEPKIPSSPTSSAKTTASTVACTATPATAAWWNWRGARKSRRWR